jgi:hypothetical protein
MIPNDLQIKLAKSRAQTELKRLVVARNAFMALSLFLGVIATAAVFGWMQANNRYANDVRVAWVKLLPSGEHEVEYIDDGGHRDRYLDRAVDASLQNYIQYRWRQRRATIERDYGAAFMFLNDKLGREFLDEFGAANVAAKLQECRDCNETDFEIRALDHDRIVAPVDGRPAVYRTTAYATEIEIARAGRVAGRHPKLVILTWRLRDMGALSKTLTHLQVNPLGIEIIEQSLRDEVPIDEGEDS